MCRHIRTHNVHMQPRTRWKKIGYKICEKVERAPDCFLDSLQMLIFVNMQFLGWSIDVNITSRFYISDTSYKLRRNTTARYSANKNCGKIAAVE